MNIPLAVIEDIIDSSGAAARIEARLPAGARRRQLTTRTLLAGMMLTLADNRPAHLTRVHAALTSLPPQAQTRLGVLADWKTARTSSPTARSSTPSAWWPQHSANTSPTARPPPACKPPATSYSRPASRLTPSTSPPRLPPTGPTSKPGPARPATAPPPAPTPKPPGATAAQGNGVQNGGRCALIAPTPHR